MGLFLFLFNVRDKSQNRTAGGEYTSYMGGSTSGKQVAERSAMQTIPCIPMCASCPKLWRVGLSTFTGTMAAVARKRR